MRLKTDEIRIRTDNIFDKLTNVYLFDSLCTFLDYEIKNLYSESKPLQISVFCVNDWKLLCDIYGLSTGDAVLAAVAKIILERLTEKNVFIARISYHEFAVVFPSMDLIDFVRVSEDIQKDVNNLQIKFLIPDSSENDYPECWAKDGVSTSQISLEVAIISKKIKSDDTYKTILSLLANIDFEHNNEFGLINM